VDGLPRQQKNYHHQDEEYKHGYDVAVVAAAILALILKYKVAIGTTAAGCGHWSRFVLFSGHWLVLPGYLVHGEGNGVRTNSD